jgi:hypothetical protein
VSTTIESHEMARVCPRETATGSLLLLPLLPLQLLRLQLRLQHAGLLRCLD